MAVIASLDIVHVQYMRVCEERYLVCVVRLLSDMVVTTMCAKRVTMVDTMRNT